jgi:hypothetical protein
MRTLPLNAFQAVTRMFTLINPGKTEEKRFQPSDPPQPKPTDKQWSLGAQSPKESRGFVKKTDGKSEKRCGHFPNRKMN